MKDLIEALQIFQQRLDATYPTQCVDGALHVLGVHRSMLNSNDIARLEQLGFVWSAEHHSFMSARFGNKIRLAINKLALFCFLWLISLQLFPSMMF